MPKLTSRPHHSTEIKNQFIGAMLVESNIKKNATSFGIPYETARKLWKKYQETGSVDNLPRSGRPKKVTDQMKAKIVQTARENRRMPFTNIGNLMNPPVGKTTVAGMLGDAGMHRCVARHVPFLTPAHKEQRLAWAEANLRKTSRGWESVIWSDECYIHMNRNSGRVWVTRTPEEVYEEGCLVPTFKQSAVCVMVWGCIAHDFKGPLIILKYPGGKGGGMSADLYQKQVLKKHLHAIMKDLRKHRRRRIKIQFQQDGASCHTAHSTIDWLEDHKIPVFPHPACSPDVSPIEPCWHELKKRIRARRPLPTTFESLKKAIQEEWAAIPISDINKYTGTMVERVRAVIDANGGHTQF
ncbi:unnamed protein product [Mycena citricolor]|uniref:Transposase n=1 Tax=Mycena citricolor TaxID=2018698 RepID=A0AAD2K7Q8_9AGAR|nr:unnamed protein product [Mycena citricolor]